MQLYTKVFIFFIFSIASNNLLARDDKNAYSEFDDWVKCDDNLCKGKYKKIKFPLDIKKNQVNLNADSTSFKEQKLSLLGNIKIRKPKLIITANEAIAIFENEKVKTISTKGVTHMSTPKFKVVGYDLFFDTKENKKVANDVTYLFYPSNARGKAKKAKLFDGKLELQNTEYTSCPPGNDFWSLGAKEITLNSKNNMAYAKKVWLKVKNKKLFYAPKLSFALDDSRRSGFLFPSITARDSIQVNIPWYWNLAPNYDLLLKTGITANRGIKFNSNFRYLGHNSNFNLIADVIPYDRKYEEFKRKYKNKFSNQDSRIVSLYENGNCRWKYNIKYHQQLTPYLKTSLKWNAISDDNYISDFRLNNQNLYATQLPQQWDLQFKYKNTRCLAELKQFKSLHPLAYNIIPNNYGYKPRFKWDLDSTKISNNLYFSANASAAYLKKDNKSPQGWRENTTLCLYSMHNYKQINLNPKLNLYFKGYALDNNSYISHNKSSKSSYCIPSVSLDTTANYYKKFTNNKKIMYMSFIPRLYYAYTPYVEQKDSIVFDTTLLNENINSIFTSRRFNGIDKIADTNKVSLGFTSRLFDNKSNEIVKLSIAQQYSFKKPKVYLNNENNIHESRASSLFSQLIFRSPKHYFTYKNDIGYNFKNKSLVLLKNSFQHKLNNKVLYTIGQSYRENKSSQIYLNGIFKVNERLKLLGSLRYSLKNNKNLSHLVGVEYDNCCFALKAAIGKKVNFDYLHRNNKDLSFVLQLTFKGLTSFADKEFKQLVDKNISKYGNFK